MQRKTTPSMSESAARAQAFILSEGGPISLRKLATLLGIDGPATAAALEELSQVLEGSGICIIRTENEVGLATSPRVSETMRTAYEDALTREIGNAGLEVLAIVLYRGASTRASIDYIRGVNSTSTIRLLLSRGLLERTHNPADAREYLYRPTPELLAHLGTRTSSELPDYDTIRSELETFERSQPAFTEHDGDTADTGENH